MATMPNPRTGGATVSETLLADLEAEYTPEAVRLLQPALDRVMDATRPTDTTLRHRRITITLRTPSSSGPVAIEHDSVLIGQADHDLAEIQNSYRDRLRKGIQTSAVMFRDRDAGQWRLRYNITTVPAAANDESSRQLAAIAGSVLSRASGICSMADSRTARSWPTELPVCGQQECPVATKCSARGSGGQWRHPLAVGGWVRRMLSPNAPPSPKATPKWSSPRRRPSSIRSPRPAVRQAAASTADSSRRYRVVRCLLVPVPERGWVEPTWTDTGHLPVAGYTPSTGR